ncbi:MAG: hypothetical protein BGO67_13155 [Alphaproteobacteria bacterium 41-28]|nr:MAG: hypothetical protein BGO67_13155 [Alphaproteobacteria bacterium 41-28]
MSFKRKDEKQSFKKDSSEEADPALLASENKTFPNDTSVFSDHPFTIAYDREFHARLGKFCALSPASIAGAYFDWFMHISISPGKQFALMESAWRKSGSFIDYSFWAAGGVKTEPCINPPPQDRRFENKDWQTWPYNIYQQAFLLTEEWWQEATSSVRGVKQHHSAILPFLTRQYHISPWKSVYKIHLFADTEITFLLTSGGHNAGIVSEPGHPHRSYQISTHKRSDKHIFPEEWFQNTPHQKGSWWPAWENWLVGHSTGQAIPPPMGQPENGYPILRDAPGIYVLGK